MFFVAYNNSPLGENSTPYAAVYEGDVLQFDIIPIDLSKSNNSKIPIV